MNKIPHDEAAERAVLGTILLRPECLSTVKRIIFPGDFYVSVNRTIYKSILEVGTDIVAIARDLEAKCHLVEKTIYSSLLDEAVSSVSVEHHAVIIADLSKIREMITELTSCTRDGLRPGVDASEFLQSTRKRILGISDDLQSGGHQTSLIHTGAPGALEAMKRFQHGTDSSRVSSGITKIDNALRGGYMPGALYLFGAPSGDGKTTYLQMMACNAARESGPVLFVSPEMSREELAEREIIRRSGISINRRGPWNHPETAVPAEMAHCDAAAAIEKEGLPVHVVEDTDITMDGVADIARGIYGLKLVIVDYAQEVADISTNLARYLAVGAVGRAAIKLGKELNIPVVVASQVNVGKGEKGALEYNFRETKDLDHRAHATMIMEVKRCSQVNQYGYHDVESTRIFAKKNRSGPLFDVQVDYRPATYLIADHVEQVWAPPRVNDGVGGY